MKYCPECKFELETSLIDGKERLACSSPSCNYVFWDNPTPVVAAIVEYNDHVILVRNKGWPQKIFGLVTGFLERGETPENGIVREIEEELGLTATIVSFIGYYSFFEMNQLILTFHARGEGELTLGDEIEEVREVDVEKLRPWPFGTGLAVKDWLKNRAARST